MENKKNHVMVDIDFYEDRARVSRECNCDGLQLMFFIKKALDMASEVCDGMGYEEICKSAELFGGAYEKAAEVMKDETDGKEEDDT